MHVGGRSATLSGLPEREITFSPGSPPVKLNPNGEFEVEQMYVQYVRLAAPKARYPLLLMHGGGLSGVTWETKPDGKPGWQSFFLTAGHDVYVADAVERGRASWARSPEIFKGEPMFRTKKEAWEIFRIGRDGSWNPDQARRAAYPGTQFPTDAFEQSMKQAVPRWVTTDAVVQAAYNTFTDKHCPCVILAHSQGGNFAFNMALAHPDKVKGVIAIESSGFPDPARNDLTRLRGIPHLFVFGDNLESSDLWSKVMPGQRRYRDALRAAGVKVDWIELPELGIRGNSHMIMMDRNSDQVAALVQQWMERAGLMK